MARIGERAVPIRAGGVDWAEHWRRLVEARHAWSVEPKPSAGNRWDARAQRFARMTRTLDSTTDPCVQAIADVARPSDTVLDIGAGAGRYTIPLAPRVARITAVEPSPGMRAALDREAEARGLKNIEIVGADWESAVVPSHDIAFVANVLYFVPEVVPFIEKLDRSASRLCFIFHRVEELATVLGPLGREIRGDRPPEAGFLDLYNLLFAMGIRPNARIVQTPFVPRFESIDDAVGEARQFLDLRPDDTSHDERIRAVLSEVLIETEQGLGFSRNPQMAIISWEKS